MNKNRVNINISKELYQKIQQRVELNPSEFTNVDEYIEFVLEEILKDEEPEVESYSSKDEEKVKQRLKRLGYF